MTTGPDFSALDLAKVAARPLSDFERSETTDLFDKSRRFFAWQDQFRQLGVLQTMYRVTLEGPLDHRIRVRDPLSGGERELICYDSNSYLGLHLHPRVVAATHRVLDEMGFGTPSAQLLGGTNRWLLALEDEIADFHEREAALVYPSGYQANIGILTGLLRADDLVIVDAYSHASIHDGARFAARRFRSPGRPRLPRVGTPVWPRGRATQGPPARTGRGPRPVTGRSARSSAPPAAGSGAI